MLLGVSRFPSPFCHQVLMTNFSSKSTSVTTALVPCQFLYTLDIEVLIFYLNLAKIAVILRGGVILSGWRSAI